MTDKMSQEEVQKVISDLAQFMHGHSALMSAHCLVCAPAMQVKIEQLLDEAQGPYGGPRLGIWNHPWCPSETVYMPRSEEELGSVILMLDDLGERMTGKKCLQPGCDDRPTSFAIQEPGRKLGLCTKHATVLNDFSFKIETE